MKILKRINRYLSYNILTKKIFYYAIRALEKSLKFKIDYHKDYNPNQQYLFAFWHGHQLLPLILCQRHNSPCAALVSASSDGEILEHILLKKKLAVIRGSSRKQNIYALKVMFKILKQGYSLGFGVDGPIGPIYKIKPGIIHMAKKMHLPILPIGSAIDRKIVLKNTWDQFSIPKLFAKTRIVVGKPIFVDEKLSINQSILDLETELRSLTLTAIEKLKY